MTEKTKSYYIPAIGWLIISTVLLTLPGSSLPKENWLGKIWFDKWVHIGLFGIMVLLWCRTQAKRPKTGDGLKNIFIKLALLWLAYGIGMEFIQKYYIPGRSFDGGDIIADAAGCALGAFYSFRRYIKK